MTNTTSQSVSITYAGSASFTPTALQQRQFFTDRTNPFYLRSSTMTQDGVYLQVNNQSVIVPMAQLYAVAANLIPTITWPPIIITQPNSASVIHTSSSFFNVTASAEVPTGMPISYQWYSSSFSQSLVGAFSQLTSSAIFTGSNTNTLTVNHTNFSMSNSQFFVVCKNISGATTSSTALLTVN